MNLRKIIEKNSKSLKLLNFRSPYLDTELLLSKAMSISREELLINLDKKLTDKKQINEFNKLFKKRKKRMPIAYILGQKEFWKYRFYVNNSVLVPRPETETIVDNALKLIEPNQSKRILDIGTGSGCIIISIIKERPKCNGTAIDISSEALKVASTNAKIHHLSNKIKFININVDKFNSNKYDLIVSNPPYIKKLDLFRLEDDVRLYEPKMALDGGFDGFAEINKVIMSSSMLLKPNGSLIIEIDERQKKYVTKNLIKNGFFIYKICDDLSGKISTIISKRKLK